MELISYRKNTRFSCEPSPRSGRGTSRSRGLSSGGGSPRNGRNWEQVAVTSSDSRLGLRSTIYDYFSCEAAETRGRAEPRRRPSGEGKPKTYISEDLRRQTTITSTYWCVCARFSLACQRRRRRQAWTFALPYHCITGARAFFGDFTWKERCSSALRKPACAGDFGFSTYKPRGIL